MTEDTIALYYSSSPNVYKVMIALEELELPYELVFVDLSRGEQFDPANLGGSLAAKVPVLRDPEPPWGGAPATIMESGAILHYLAEKTGRLLPDDPAARSAAMQWLFWQMGNLGPIGGQYWHFRTFAPRLEPETDFTYPARRYTRMLTAIWDVMECRLTEVPFLSGDIYSIADIACYPWAAYLTPDANGGHAAIGRWRAALAERPAVVRAYARNSDFEVGYGRNERQGVAYPWDGLKRHTIVS